MDERAMKEVLDRINMIWKDLTILQKKIGDIHFENQEMDVPIKVKQKDIPENEWTLLNKIEALRKKIFSITMKSLMR